MNRLCLHVCWLTLCAWLLAIAPANAQSVEMDTLLPDNTEMAFSFNVKSVLNSPIYQKHFKEDLEKHIKENTKLQQVMTSLGFDPLKDLTAIIMTFSKFNVRGPGQPPDVDAFVVAKGAFNVEKMNGALGALIAAANQGDKVSTSQYGNFTIYEVKDSNSNRSFFASILSKDTVIGSTVKQQVTEAIDRSVGNKAGKLNDKFAALLNKARNQDTMWGAMLLPASVKDMAKMSPNPEAGEVISKFESQTMALNVRDNVRFSVNMNMADAAAATQLKTLMDQAKELLGAAALSNDQIGAELADLVGSLQIGARDKMVSMQGEAKADLVDKVVKMIKDRSR